MDTFTVASSWGKIVVDAKTGYVDRAASTYARDPQNEQGDYPICNIYRFDLDEWCKTYPAETAVGKTYDILDFGYWTFSRTLLRRYEAPDAEWRAEFRAQLKAGEIHSLP